jgi:hypothetical protein
MQLRVKKEKQSQLRLQKKQADVVVISDCVNLLSHVRTASVIRECLQTQSVSHQQADNIFSQTFSLWTLFWTVNFSRSSPHSLLTPYCSLVSCKMIVLRGILSLLLMLVSLSLSSGSFCLFCRNLLGYSCDTVLSYLKLCSLSVRKVPYVYFFLTIVFNDSNYCHKPCETVGLRVPNRSSRVFGLFNLELKTSQQRFGGKLPSAVVLVCSVEVPYRLTICNSLILLPDKLGFNLHVKK